MWGELRSELEALDRALPELPILEIADRGKRGAIKLTGLDAQPEAPNLLRLKREVKGGWGIVALVDMLKEAILRTGCLDTIKEMSRSARLSPETLAERLLLVLYAYGTNTGISSVGLAITPTARTICATCAAGS